MDAQAPGRTEVKRALAYAAILALLYLTTFWGDVSEHTLGMDSMTYAGLARRILLTGDWKTLHYSSMAFADFHQHPPLAIWIDALAFSLLGTNELAALVVSGAYGLGTLLAVVLWAMRMGGSAHGFLSGIVLLSSTRFIKYGNQLMLDGPLAFWLAWGGYFLSLGSRPLAMIGLGACLAGAVLTKGLAAMALPLVMFALVAFMRDRARYVKGLLGSLAIFAGVMLAWFALGDGWNYLQQYWITSLQGRLAPRTLSGMLAPSINLLKVYWPWLPFWCFGIFYRQLLLPTAMSLAILFGLTLNGNFLEHYMTPFYPFAAIVAARPLVGAFLRHERRATLVLGGIAVALLVAVQVLPLHVRGGGYQDPIRQILKETGRRCDAQAVRQLLISEEVTGLWMGLAMGTWYTPWDTLWVPQRTPARVRDQLFLANSRAGYLPEWAPTPLRSGEDWVILEPAGAHYCK